MRFATGQQRADYRHFVNRDALNVLAQLAARHAGTTTATAHVL
jgi:hypothetical protein